MSTPAAAAAVTLDHVPPAVRAQVQAELQQLFDEFRAALFDDDDQSHDSGGSGGSGVNCDMNGSVYSLCPRHPIAA